MRARVRRIQRSWVESQIALRAHPLRMLQIALPWLLGLFVLLPLLWHEMDRAAQEPGRRAGQETVSYAGRSMLRWIERLRDDTRFLAALTPRLVQSDARPESPLLDTYTSFLRAGTAYHKVRWIDARGRERLRVDQEDGRITEVPGRQLQDKSGRPFFEHGLALQAGQVHLSPLDLNVEHGRLEQPYRPTLRASSPFVHADGEVGVVVVNLHGQALLDRLRAQAGRAGFELYLVHPQGYWLVGPEPGDGWGWQLGRPERP